jgi:hypothetical protein
MLRRTCALVSIAFALSLFSATVAATTAQRTFVASTGNDANPCSIAAPCRGFTRAITQTSPAGEVIVLDSAGYGPVTVTKSVSIIAPAGIYAGISVFSGDGVTVNAPVATVVLRGISISGQGGSSGIAVQAVARLRVENCVISGLASDGIHLSAAGAELIVLDTIVRDNGGTGIGVGADLPSISLDHVRSEHNTVDGFHVAPTLGSLGAIATVTDSVFTHNGANGIGANDVSGATTTITVERSVMASNGLDGFVVAEDAGGSAVLGVSRNAINDNGGNGISTGGNMQGTVSDNVLKRNSGYAVLASSALGGSVITLAGNVVEAHLGGAIRATGTGARLEVSANTVPGIIGCDNGAQIFTYENNATGVLAHQTGCTVDTLGLH